MAYTALYRKFRPDTFLDVKGQEPIVRTLSNQIKRGRVGHAYLFCGTRGTGKTSVAKILARAINCEHPVDGSPCNECAVCKGIINGTSMNVVEIDAASNNGVDSIRQIVEEVRYSPTEGKYRVYIIDEVHMLSTGAFNALLKTLEEPPSYVVFILATTEAHKIPITILSRCQRYDFKRISIDTITARLRELCDKEGIKAEEGALRYVAKCGEGSMRDSLSLLERCIAFYFEEELTYDKVLDILGGSEVEQFAELLRFIDSGLVDECMEMIERQVVEGRDLTRFIVDFTWYMRNLLLAKTGKNINDLLEVSSEQMELLHSEACIFQTDELMRYISICCELTNKLRYATQKRVLIETEMIKLCKPSMEISDEAFKDRIRRLEAELDAIKKGGLIPASGTETVSDVQAAAPDKDTEKPQYEAALTEDLIEVENRWEEIRKQLPPRWKPTFIGVKLGVSDDGKKLQITMRNEQDYIALIGSHVEQYIVIIEEAIADIIGKHVDIEIRKKSEGSKAVDDATKVKELLDGGVYHGIPVVTGDTE